jgi:creatinine amidohydrolase
MPALWLGCSHHHADFAGTVSVHPDLYSEMIQQMVMCVLDAGFTRVVLLNGHGGNHTPVTHAITNLNGRCDKANDALVVLATWWITAAPSIKADKIGMTTPRVSHACEYETSLLLSLRPDLVAMDKIVESKPAYDNKWFQSEYGGRVTVMHRFRTLAAAGSMGTPSLATAEKGKRLLDAVVGEIAGFVEDLRTWPLPRRLGPA